MVSFQKLPELSEKTPRKRPEDTETLMPTKKRRSSEVQEFLDEKRWRSNSTPATLLIDVDLRLQTPLPWQNNLAKQTQNLIRDTQKTTSSDKDPISLDLGLNLLCSTKSSSTGSYHDKEGNFFKHGGKGVDGAEEEMVAKACMRCHMLVMMCKSSPSCPNCKFMHPLDQNAQSAVLMKARTSNKASSCVS